MTQKIERDISNSATNLSVRIKKLLEEWKVPNVHTIDFDEKCFNLKFFYMFKNVSASIQQELDDLKNAGLYKQERIITTPQSASIKTTAGGEVLNFCANNYLGLSSHPEVVKAAKETIDTHGYGMSSVRFVCGTQDIHKELEKKTAAFLGALPVG